MSELPPTWEVATIADMTVDCAQRVPADEESILYIDIASVDRDTKSITSPQALLGKDAPSRARKHVRTGDTLVSMTRPNLNAVALVPDRLDGQIASTGFDVLRAPELDPRWLYYIVRTTAFVGRMSELVQGALYPAVRSKDVRGYEAPLAPLNEQKRIADKLDAVLARVDACRERLDRVPAILKRFRQSVLAAATSGKLTEEWREGLGFTSGTRSSAGLFDIPEGWGWETTGVVADVKGGKRLPKGEKLVNYDTGFPYIKAGQLKNGTVEKEGQEYLTPSVQRKIKRYIVEKGDVYITIVGAYIGDSGVIPPEYDKANLTENAAKICNLHGVLSDYLAYWLRSPAAQDQINFLVKSGAQGKLALMRIKDIPVPLPDIREQQEIIRRIESLFAYADRLEARYTAARAQVERLTPALLAKAFRGELVSQDPSDEPAAVLLERVRAARAVAEETGVKKGQRGALTKAARTRQKEDLMLEINQVQPDHLTSILKKQGRLSPKTLWQASQLGIEDFYEQLRAEEEKRLLHEVREGADCFLEAA